MEVISKMLDIILFLKIYKYRLRNRIRNVFQLCRTYLSSSDLLKRTAVHTRGTLTQYMGAISRNPGHIRGILGRFLIHYPAYITDASRSVWPETFSKISYFEKYNYGGFRLVAVGIPRSCTFSKLGYFKKCFWLYRSGPVCYICRVLH